MSNTIEQRAHEYAYSNKPYLSPSAEFNIETGYIKGAKDQLAILSEVLEQAAAILKSSISTKEERLMMAKKIEVIMSKISTDE